MNNLIQSIYCVHTRAVNQFLCVCVCVYIYIYIYSAKKKLLNKYLCSFYVILKVF